MQFKRGMVEYLFSSSYFACYKLALNTPHCNREGMNSVIYLLWMNMNQRPKFVKTI